MTRENEKKQESRQEMHERRESLERNLKQREKQLVLEKNTKEMRLPTKKITRKEEANYSRKFINTNEKS